MTLIIALMLNTLIQHVTGENWVHPVVIFIAWFLISVSEKFVFVEGRFSRDDG